MHKHLTWTDRLKIEKALKEGLKPCKIADRLQIKNVTFVDIYPFRAAQYSDPDFVPWIAGLPPDFPFDHFLSAQ